MTYAVNPTIFRAYDIRGVVDVDLSEAVYHTLGRAAGTYFRQRNAEKSGNPRIVVGRLIARRSSSLSGSPTAAVLPTAMAATNRPMSPTPMSRMSRGTSGLIGQ